MTSKIHARCDGLGNPTRLTLTEGQAHDCTEAANLLEGLEVDAVLADKGYDSDAVIDRIVATGAEAVIPPKANRKFSGPAIMPCIANAISSNGSSIN